MFSTMQNQKRAEELIAEAKSAISEADRIFHEAKERLQKNIAQIDAVRSHFAHKTVMKFRDLFGKMENEPPIELAPISEQPFSEQLEPLFQKATLEPVTIEDVRRGKGGAFFGALLASLFTVVLALVIGAVGAGLPLAPETFTQMPKIMRILEWLGGGAIAPNLANPLYGAGGLILAALAAWMITWSLRMSKAARRNLAKAEKIHEAATRYADKRTEYAASIEALSDKLESFENELQTCDLFMQEFNAALRRILHTEGEDYHNFRPSSRRIVERAAACAQGAVPLLDIAIVTTEGTPSTQLEHAVTYAKLLVDALIEEREIPSYQEFLSDSEEEENSPIVLPYHKEEDEDKRASEEEEEAAESLPSDRH